MSGKEVLKKIKELEEQAESTKKFSDKYFEVDKELWSLLIKNQSLIGDELQRYRTALEGAEVNIQEVKR